MAVLSRSAVSISPLSALAYLDGCAHAHAPGLGVHDGRNGYGPHAGEENMSQAVTETFVLSQRTLNKLKAGVVPFGNKQ